MKRRREATLLFLNSPEAVAAVKRQLGLDEPPGLMHGEDT